MSITAEQKEWRTKFLGSSDLAAIVGLDKWKNSSDVYLEKTSQLEAERENGNLPADIGQIFEHAVLQLFAKVRGVSLIQDVFLTHGIFCSNLDALIEADNEIVEAKTCGDPDEYGEQYTDEIPERHIVQTHEQMYVVSAATGRECKVAWVPVLLPGYKSLQFKIYKVLRNDDLMKDLIQLGESFWHDHIVNRVPPEPYQPSLTLLKRIKRVPDQITDISDAIVNDWAEATAAHLQADAKLKLAKSRLIAALGDGDAGETETGRMITYFETNRTGYTVEPTTYRTPRLKPAKKKRGSNGRR